MKELLKKEEEYNSNTAALQTEGQYYEQLRTKVVQVFTANIRLIQDAISTAEFMQRRMELGNCE
jgi:hypothetical protein